jgi:hypothetical protein
MRATVLLGRVRAYLWPAALVCWGTVLLFLATYNLERYPLTWFDEGSHLHVPKTLVQYGVYADRSEEGFRYFGPTTGVGPTVMLPIAGVFKVAGIGLVQARLVMVGYLMLALFAFAIVARRLYGNLGALLATTLLVTSPGISLLSVGRQVLGEVPALAFLMLGIFFWYRSLDANGQDGRKLAAASIAFGLVALTKNQFALVLVPSLIAMWAADQIYFRVLRLREIAWPLGAVIVGTVTGQLTPLIPLIGTDEFARTLQLTRQASGGAIFVFSPARILTSLKLLFSADVFAYWGLPALLYGIVLARGRDRDGIRYAFLLIFAVVSLGWYALGSIGWPRYAFPGLAVMTLFVARLFLDLLRSGYRTAPDTTAIVRTVALTSVVVIMIGASLIQQAREIVTARDDSPQQVAAFLNAEAPRDAIVETWEPELGFLTDHAYHYPPSGWLDRAVRAQWLGGQRVTDYDPVAESKPAYLVVGRFGTYTGLYTPFLQREQPEHIASFGAYDVYRARAR